MSKFLLLILTSLFYYTFAYISVYLLYQDLFEKRVPTKPVLKSLFFKEKTKKVNTSDPTPIPNSDFPYQFSYLNIDSTNQLNLSKYGCSPISFGYSQQDGKRIFPDFEYPDCSEKTQIKKSRLTINRSSNTLTLNCSQNAKGFYFSGPIPDKTLMKKENTDSIPINEYFQSVDAKNVEYALGFCEDSKEKKENFQKKNDFQHGAMSPVFNKALYESSKKFVKDVPKTVVLLTLDSFSRRHFYRKLPRVVRYLNESEKTLPGIAVYDFQLHTTFGSDSVHNQVPIFAGKDYRRKRSSWEDDTLGEFSMWSDMKKHGYVTVMGYDDCDNWFPDVLGENPKVDYSVRQFYCLVDQYTGVRTERNDTEQRCLGPHQTHSYILNYTLDLIQLYQGVNLWIYLHLNAAHEKTGQHAATLDKDLLQFLHRFFSFNTSEIVLFLGADHGMRYGRWYNSIDSYQETKLPSMFLLTSKSLLNTFKFSHHTLHENSKRLTSKLDIRQTILSLINYNEPESSSVNWLTEIASYKRNCEDLESDMLYCACSPLQEIKKYDSATREMVKAIKEHTEKVLNYNSYFFSGFPPGKFCDQVKLDKVEKLYHMGVGREIEVFKVEFGSSEHDGIRLEVNAILSSNWFLINEKNKSVFRPFNVAVKGFRYRVRVRGKQIVQISRLDKYSGKCQGIAEGNGIPADQCIRKSC